MSIMDFFRGAATPNTQVAQPGQTPPTAVQPGGATSPTNPTVPAATQSPQGTPGTQNTPTTPEPSANQSPLDQFADLWKTDPNAATPGTIDNLFNIDPAKLQEAAAKTNFSQVISQDTIQKMAAGGQEAVEAFSDSMNKVAQAVYAQSAMATAKIVEQALGKAQASYDARIPNLIKQHQVSDNLRNESPIFNNPAVSPLISAMEVTFTQKYPNASAGEITKMAKDYIAAIATSFSPAPPAPAPSNPNEYDWSKFL